MSEQKKEVRAVELTLECDSCGVEMPVVKALTSLPPQFVHECPECLHQEIHQRAYPCVDYEEVE
jgi:hypothetical protein